jgi:PAS domain S-box-containing protein
MGRGLDLVARRADGTTFPVDIMLNPLKHLAEPMVLAVVRDVTDRRAAEDAVHQSRTMFEKFYEQSPDAIIVVDETGKIDRVNGPAEALFGLPRQRMVGQSIEMLLPERFRNRHSAHRAGYMKEAKTRPMGTGLPLFAQRADGSEFPVDIMLSPMEIAQRPLVLAVVRDTTARKNAEEAQAHLAAIVTSSTDAIIGKTVDGIVTSWNEAAERMFGYQASEMIGQPIRRLIPTDRQAEEDMILGRVAQGERVEHYETVRNAKDGRTIDVSITVSPMRGAEGRIIGASKIARDITAGKRAEGLLRHQADLLDQSHDAIFTWKIGGGITYWSKGAEALYGYTAEEIIGRSSHELLRTCSPVPIHEIEAQIANEGRWYGELAHTTRDGRTIVVESRHVRVNYDGESYALETNRDITARKQAEEALRKSEERFRSSVLHSPLPTILFDDQEHIIAISQSWLDQTGYSRAELRHIEDWTARAHGEQSGEVLAQIRQTIPTEPEAQRSERMIRTKGGRNRLWSFVSSALGAQSDGRCLFVCVAEDLTERKAQEEQVQLLMRESNHRAKNMLSLVQAIARQTAAREPEDFVARFSERIRALAANQDLLVRNEWQGVDAEDLVLAQLAHFADLVGSRIAMRGPKLRLNAAAAQAIGLALHELATNAGKYGALSTDRGRVDVCWGTDRDTFTISWTERDGPTVSPPERRGFGSTVIASMAKATIGGEVQLDYAPSGVVWRLTCPAANGLEEARRKSATRDAFSFVPVTD